MHGHIPSFTDQWQCDTVWNLILIVLLTLPFVCMFNVCYYSNIGQYCLLHTLFKIQVQDSCILNNYCESDLTFGVACIEPEEVGHNFYGMCINFN